MANINTTRPKGPRFVNAVCTSVEDMGLTPTPFGIKPLIKFTFESEEVNEYGDNRRYTRLFHKHIYKFSALSIAVKSWTGRDLEREADHIDDVDFKAFEKLPAVLKLEPGNVKNGRRYENIIEIIGVDEDAQDTECESVCETNN